MKHTITLIPGDGIGPEVSRAVKQILEAAGVEIEWEEIEPRAEIERRGIDFMQAGVVESIRKNRVALKGPLATAVATGAPSINVGLRKALDLYANLRPVKNLEGVQSRFQDVDLVIVPRKYRRPLRGAGAHGGSGSGREPENHHGKSLHAHRAIRI